MERLEELRESIKDCDEKLIQLLEQRMNHVNKMIDCKKKNGIPFIQPELEKSQDIVLKKRVSGIEFEDEIYHILKSVLKNEKKVQAKRLFDYNIFLIGFMGAGKSTVASGLEHLLEMERIEMDAAISKKQRMSIPEIFDKLGENYFRDLESNMLLELQKKSQMIVSCGGGIVIRPENILNMKEHGRVVLLTASPETIYDRVKDSRERPILNENMSVEYIELLMEKRKEKYMSAADVVINTDGKNVVEICEEMIEKLVKLDGR